MEAEGSEDVLRFWFPELGAADHATMIGQFEWWFRGGNCREIPLVVGASEGAVNWITGLSRHDRGWRSLLFWTSSLAPYIRTRRERSHKIRKPSPCA